MGDILSLMSSASVGPDLLRGSQFGLEKATRSGGLIEVLITLGWRSCSSSRLRQHDRSFATGDGREVRLAESLGMTDHVYRVIELLASPPGDTYDPRRAIGTLASRRSMSRIVVNLISALIVVVGAGITLAPHASAGLAPPELVYLYDVTVHRPDYNFPDADAALAYGYRICDKIAGDRPYTQIAGEVKADFHTSDEYKASYLISDAAQQLCPQLIWQLRNSAANYTPPPAP